MVFLGPGLVSEPADSENKIQAEILLICVKPGLKQLVIQYKLLKTNENYTCDIILQLRPTSPTRNIEDINKALQLFIKNRNKFDSLRSVIPFDKSPYKMYRIQNNYLKVILEN